MLQEGDQFIHPIRFTQNDVNLFSQVTGDTNPIHLDPEYAAGTVFRKPIIHGFLGASIFSKVLGTQFPGEGTVYLKQSIDFAKPMYVDNDYQAVFTVLSIERERHKAIIETKITDLSGNRIFLTGEALIRNSKHI